MEDSDSEIKKPEFCEEKTSRSIFRHFKMAWRDRGQIIELLKDTSSAWSEDNVPRLGASLAYYTALSLAPLVLVVLAVAGLAFGKQAVQGELVWQIRDAVGEEGAKAIQDLIKASREPSSGIIATIVGLLTLFFGASSVVMELSDALNTIWHVPRNTDQTSLKSIFTYMRQRFVSFAMVLGVGFLLLVSLVVNAVLSAMGKFFDNLLPMPEYVLHVANLILSFLVITVLFAMIYKVLPDVHIKWSDVAVGAAVTSLLFTLGKFLLGLYLGKSSIASTYGAAGSFIIILVWVYYSAQVFYIGAEFTRMYSKRFGSRFTTQLQVTPERLEPEKLIIDTSSGR
ncbi:MAG: YihY/virulence factor BrkB family protein [Acidobacteriota bacterium]|nr:YihY/virulence factor BrkB family protein [Acidobacteriota bacterium]